MRYVTSVERLATERGLQQGMQQGMQQGLQQGEVAVLKRQLCKRFGELSEEIELRLNKATLEQLEIWADRVLDARTVEEVFGAH